MSRIVCHFCDSSAADVDQAIDRQWVPSFWDAESDREAFEPVCSGCARTFLKYDEECQDYVYPPTAVPVCVDQ